MKMKRDPYKKMAAYLIPIVGVLVSGISCIHFGATSSLKNLIQVGHSILMTGGIWMGCMGIVQFLWKKYPWQQYPAKHLIIEIVAIMVYTVAFSSLLYFIELTLEIISPVDNLFIQAVITMLITYLITAIHESVYFYNQWKYNFSKSIRLERDTIQAKYESLKTQVNPHFLFNSLNSLTTLVDENLAAVDYIGNLSEFLRYMLGSNEKEFVLIRDEIQILKKYISLQKSRFKDNLSIAVEVPEKFYHFAVPPLVLQMLVENSLKHNVVSKDKPLRISITAEKESLFVENNLQRKSEVTSTGRGLKNIADRYRLFTTREVIITETSTIFKVEIPLLMVEL